MTERKITGTGGGTALSTLLVTTTNFAVVMPGTENAAIRFDHCHNEKRHTVLVFLATRPSF